MTEYIERINDHELRCRACDLVLKDTPAAIARHTQGNRHAQGVEMFEELRSSKGGKKAPKVKVEPSAEESDADVKRLSKSVGANAKRAVKKEDTREALSVSQANPRTKAPAKSPARGKSPARAKSSKHSNKETTPAKKKPATPKTAGSAKKASPKQDKAAATPAPVEKSPTKVQQKSPEKPKSAAAAKAAEELHADDQSHAIMYAVAAAFCAVAGSVITKLVLSDWKYTCVDLFGEMCADNESMLMKLAHFVAYLTIFVPTGLMWLFFSKSLDLTSSSLVTAAVTSTCNIVFTALAGAFIFHETTSLQFWFAISLMLLGAILISSPGVHVTDAKKKD